MFESPADWFLFSIVMLVGACFGSFANVVIYRLPAGLSVVRPGSYCWACNTPIKLRHNLPVIGWFFLRGRCANCKTKYSFRYPAVEILMAVLFGFAFYKIGWNWSLFEALILIFGLVTVSFIDFDHERLPDKFTLPGIVIGLIGALLNPERDFLTAVYGVLLGGGFLWAIAYLYELIRQQEGMGGGDIKLLAWIGAVLGWKSVPFIILVASISGSIVGVGAMLLSKKSKTETGSQDHVAAEPEAFRIPFGPFLSTAALIYLLLDGEKVIAWYLDLHKL